MRPLPKALLGIAGDVGVPPVGDSGQTGLVKAGRHAG
jgi:hypothetical protein